MEQQRPLRLGDLVDDYCPKERRITNHVIVAIVEDTIRQTRCTACEADHVYKGGKTPARRKPKDQPSALFEEVLTNLTSTGTPVPAPDSEPAVEAVVVAEAPAPVAPALAAEPLAATPAAPAGEAPTPEPAPPAVIEEGWSLNRRLIRASLPRIDGQPPVPRAIPEFTMHQRNVRGSQQFRSGGYGNGNGNGNGNGGGWQDRSGNGHSNNGHRNGFRPEGQGDGQPGVPNGHRPGGSSRRRRRHKSHRPPQN